MLTPDRSKPGRPPGFWHCPDVQVWEGQIWEDCPQLDPEVCHGMRRSVLHRLMKLQFVCLHTSVVWQLCETCVFYLPCGLYLNKFTLLVLWNKRGRQTLCVFSWCPLVFLKCVFWTTISCRLLYYLLCISTIYDLSFSVIFTSFFFSCDFSVIFITCLIWSCQRKFVTRKKPQHQRGKKTPQITRYHVCSTKSFFIMVDNDDHLLPFVWNSTNNVSKKWDTIVK